jgi:predicted RNase H-like HicB family nuclease
MTDALQPGSEMSVTVRGYEVIVRISEDGTLQVTCPDLPQVDVRDQTLASALARAEDAIARRR